MSGFGEGVRVEASILARLLGIKLLKLDATVLVLPEAEVRETLHSSPPNLVIRARPTGRPSKRTVTEPSGDDPRLADAVRTLDEGARLLEEVRRNGVTH